jgi:hypothetical protein
MMMKVLLLAFSLLFANANSQNTFDSIPQNEIQLAVENSRGMLIIFFLCGNLVLVDKLSFHPYAAGFYKPTVLKVHPPFCSITAYETMPG